MSARIGVVIGSGGVKCAAAVGLVRILEREGIPVDVAVGCSGGGLYAASIALGYTSEEMAYYNTQLWSPDLMAGYTDSLRSIKGLATRFSEKEGLADDDNLNAVLAEVFGEATFADTQLPLYILAADVYTGESVTLSSGSIYDATRATVAIPTVFPPHQVGEHLLFDGAVANPLPVDVAIQHGADVILAMGFEMDTRSRMRSILAVNNHLNALYINNLLKTSFAFNSIAHHGELIPILPEFERSISTMDAGAVEAVAEAGERAAEAALPNLLRLLA
jgi:NTE family protein